MNEAKRLKALIADGDISGAVTSAAEVLEAVLQEIEDTRGTETLDQLGWELCRATGEEKHISLLRCIGSHIVNTRCTDWRLKDKGATGCGD